ncbi:uncharacterized protein LOC143255875 isoform X2 [Tachypleus tridentatus]
MWNSLEEAAKPSCGAREPHLILDLTQAVHVGFTADSRRFPYGLVLVCQGKMPLLMAAEDELSARSWLLALGLIAHKGSENAWRNSSRQASGDDTCSGGSNSSQGILVQEFLDPLDTMDGCLLPLEYMDSTLEAAFARERFSVMIHHTEASERAGLKGEYHLVILGHSVGLAKTGQTDCFLLWPIAYVRQYKHETLATTAKSRTTLVTLEVGRRCSTGEGVFQFKTQRGQEIILELKRAIALWSARKAAVVALRQSRSLESRTSSHRLWTRGGRSAPSTPFLSIPHLWNTCPEIWSRKSASPSRHQQDDVNYIIPVFECSNSSPGNDSNSLSPDLLKKKGSHHEHSGQESEPVEQATCDNTSCIRTSLPSKSDKRFSQNSTTPHMEKLQRSRNIKSLKEIRESEGYIEVLPT